MADNPRIEELRRRVQTDPASIAFAQLAEEYRRAGCYQEAIAACDAGLKIHPGYLSARVTLGRALIEVDDLDVAEVELRQVLQIASENLAAIRGLAEIYHRRGQLPEALRFYQSALVLAKHDPDLEQTVAEISRALTTEPAPVEDDGMSFAEAAGFLCRDKDEVRRKATQLRLSGACAAPTSVPRMVVPAVRLQITEAQHSIQKAGSPTSIERCRLLLARIDAALLKTRSEDFVNIAPVAQGALERANLVLRRCSRPW